MSFAFKNESYELTDVDQVLFTAPEGTQVIAVGLRASNVSDTSALVTVKRNSAVQLAEFNLTGDDTTLPIKSSLNIADGNRFVLMAGDELIARADAIDKVHLTLEYLELPVQEQGA